MALALKDIVQLIDLAKSTFDQLDERKFKKLMAGKAKLEYVEIHENGNHEKLLDKVIELNQIIDKIEMFNNEVELLRFLTDDLDKNDVEVVAKHYGILVNGKMSEKKLIEKIVGTTIGLSMRGNAIRKTKLKK